MDLKESVAIPGTKIKLPIIEVVAAGAAVIGAYVLLKGGSAQGADASAAPTGTSTTDATNPSTDNSILNGEIETMAQDLAALQAAQQAQGVGGAAANVTSAATSALPAASLPTTDVTTPGGGASAIITDSINPKAVITQTGPGTYTVANPGAKSEAKQITRLPASAASTPAPSPVSPLAAALSTALTDLFAMPSTSSKSAPSAPKVAPSAPKSVAPVAKITTSTKSVNPAVGKVSTVAVKTAAKSVPVSNPYQNKSGQFI